MQAARQKVAVAKSSPAAPAVQVTGRAPAASVQPHSLNRVSAPGDPTEREASETAKRIMRMAAPEGVGGPAAIPRPGAVRSFLSPYVARFAETRGLIGRSTAGVFARKAEGQPNVASSVSADIQSSVASGAPLPLSVRRFMEPRFGADFGDVRVHTGERAAGLNRTLSAQAFTVGNQIFFGRDRFRPETGEGRELIAHELTHTIQQGAAVQRREDVTVTGRAPTMVQRLGLSDVLDYFADKANIIPGYRMFTVILGVNPINMSRVERSAANILRAVVELLPGGYLITQALDNYGVFDKVGAWVEQQIRSLGMSGAMFRQALDKFLDSLSWTDIFHPGDVWDRAKRIFTEPIGRLIDFGKGLVVGILKFIKDAILRPLAKLAEGTRGYDLLKAVLGEDPITGEPVPRTADTLIGGFMKLIGQEEVWNNLKKANAVARAWAWFQGALAGLMGFVRQIPALFMAALQSLQIADIVLLPRAFLKVAGVFGGFIVRFLSWAGQQVLTLLQIIFEVLAPAVMPYIRKAAGAFRKIIENPIRFIGNLVKAGIQGFKQFGTNFLTHLRTSLIGWLTGTLSGANIYIPQAFELKEIIKFVLSVLGLTWQNIRQKLVKVIGETAVTVLEKGFDIVVTLVREGPAAAWEKIKENISNLKDMVMEQIMTFVRDRIVQAAITRLVTSLNPAGAFIQAIIAIYNTIMFFVERLRQIAQVVAAFIDSISAIADGVITAAANKVEQTMAGLLTLVISFLARLVGLGKVSDAVVNIVNKIRAPIDKAIDKVIEWIVATAKKLGKLVATTAKRLVAWWTMRRTFKADGEDHVLFFRGEGPGAEMVVASRTMAVEEFLAEKSGGSDARKEAAKEIRRLLKKAKDLIGKIKPGQEDEETQKKIEDIMNDMGPYLVLLLSTTEWGTEANPAPMDYYKRRAASYPVFYLAIGAPRLWKQDTLKERFGQKEYKDKIWRFLPTATGQKSPGGERVLGLDVGSQLEVGKKVEFDDRQPRGGQVSAFKDLVIKYGFRPSDYGYDVDHVVELQIGGRDEFINLWPLPAGENRSSGSLLKNTPIEPRGEPKQLIAEAKKKKKTDPLWLLIKTTRQL